MDRKYRVKSATSLLRMLITFEKTTDDHCEPVSVAVSVDYLNDKIYFDNPHELTGLDLEELEAEILCSLRPQLLEPPEIPPELMSKIQDVRAGNYGGDVPSYQGFTG